MNDPVSILVCVGESNYSLSDVMDEYRAIGVSKRLPLTNIPSGLVKGESKILVAHPKAIVRTTVSDKDMMELAYVLYDAGYISETDYQNIVELPRPFWENEKLHSEDFVPVEMLTVTYALSTASKTNPEFYRDLLSNFGLEFCMGVIGYAPFSGVQVVLKNDEDDLPEELEHLRPLVEQGYVEMVHVAYTDDEGKEEYPDVEEDI